MLRLSVTGLAAFGAWCALGRFGVGGIVAYGIVIFIAVVAWSVMDD